MGSKSTERKKLQRKRKRQREMISVFDIPMPCSAVYSLGTLPTPAMNGQEKKKESKMFYNLDKTSTVEGTQRNFLMDDLSSSHLEHRDTLQTMFNLDPRRAPRTFADLVTAITTGQYTPPEKDSVHDWIEVLDRPKWGDPTKKPDSAGFDLALKALEKVYSDAQRDVVTLPIADARTASVNFEAWTYTPTTVH
jgi:hypothetical protein